MGVTLIRGYHSSCAALSESSCSEQVHSIAEYKTGSGFKYSFHSTETILQGITARQCLFSGENHVLLSCLFILKHIQQVVT